jgi:hypothetical protein
MAAVVVAVERRLHFTDKVGLYFPRPFHAAPRHAQMNLHPARERGALLGWESGLIGWRCAGAPVLVLPQHRGEPRRSVELPRALPRCLVRMRERIVSAEASSPGAMPMYNSPSLGCVGCAAVGTEGNAASSVSHHA